MKNNYLNVKNYFRYLDDTTSEGIDFNSFYYSLFKGVSILNNDTLSDYFDKIKNFMKDNNFNFKDKDNLVVNINEFISFVFNKNIDELSILDVYNILNKFSMEYYNTNINSKKLYEIYFLGIDYDDFEYFNGMKNFSIIQLGINLSSEDIEKTIFFDNEILETNKHELIKLKYIMKYNSFIT